MKKNQFAVIMAGGRGERFWPMSTKSSPKQMLTLLGGKTLLAQAVDRLQGLFDLDHIFIITNADLVDATRNAIPELPPAQVIGEPVGRDTGAAVALGAALIKARDPSGVFCVLTADHVIGKLNVFRKTLERSMILAEEESVMITVGIPPTEPSSAYGYIESGEIHLNDGGQTFFHVKRFVEKPNVEKARKYLESGRFYWNSGMFIWSVNTIMVALSKFRPQLLGMASKLIPFVGTPAFTHELEREYEGLEKISIDYAVMEKADNILMVRSEFTWDDVGSWTALRNHFKEDKHENVFIGDVVSEDCTANIVYSKGHVTALLGVEGLIVVQAEGVTLICSEDRAQDIKKIVKQIKKDDDKKHLL